MGLSGKNLNYAYLTTLVRLTLKDDDGKSIVDANCQETVKTNFNIKLEGKQRIVSAKIEFNDKSENTQPLNIAFIIYTLPEIMQKQSD